MICIRDKDWHCTAAHVYTGNRTKIFEIEVCSAYGTRRLFSAYYSIMVKTVCHATLRVDSRILGSKDVESERCEFRQSIISHETVYERSSALLLKLKLFRVKIECNVMIVQ